MKLTEYENEAALDLLADLIDPATVIFSDPVIAKAMRTGGNNLEIVKHIIKEHQKPVIQILAILDGVKVEDYHANIPKMIAQLLEALNDEELINFFTSVAPRTEKRSSGSVMESTEGKGE